MKLFVMRTRMKWTLRQKVTLLSLLALAIILSSSYFTIENR
jgi:hypothetical protein